MAKHLLTDILACGVQWMLASIMKLEYNQTRPQSQMTFLSIPKAFHTSRKAVLSDTHDYLDSVLIFVFRLPNSTKHV